jgi:hypothetical protein
MKKTVLLRRKELMNHLPKEVRVSAKTKLGSIYVGRQPLRGVEGQEEKDLLNGILDVGPDHADFVKHAKKFWSELTLSIPFEGITLDVSRDSDDKPYNAEDYLKYKFALKHPQVALNKEDMNSTHRFYIHDTTRDLIIKNNEIQVRKDADKEFIKVTADDKKMTRILRILSTDRNPEKMTLLQKENTLYDLKNKDPKKFYKVATDRNLEVKAEIEELVSAGVLRRIGNQVVYLDEVIGETMEDAVVYLKNKKNSGTLTILRVKLKEAVI